MSIGAYGIFGSVAATPAAQSGAETQRAAQDFASQNLAIASDLKAEEAAGIGTTDGDNHETSERDADGRRLWEKTSKPKRATAADAPGDSQPESAVLSKDATGQAGNSLDLVG